MKGLREFEVPYVGLKLGVHQFNYDIDSEFFKHFEDSPIQDCKVKVRVEFEKKETVSMICDASKVSLFRKLCKHSGLR